MALILSVDFKGIEVKDAYVKIPIYQGDNNLLAFAVTYHAKKGEKAFDVKDFQCQLDLNGPNSLKQAYLFLKSLPEFSAAIDVLEED